MRIRHGELGAKFITGVSVNGRKINLDERPVLEINTDDGYIDVALIDTDGRPRGKPVMSDDNTVTFVYDTSRIKGKIDVEWMPDFENNTRRVSNFAGGNTRRFWFDIRVDDTIRDAATIFKGDGVFIPQEHMENMTSEDFERLQNAAMHFDETLEAAKAESDESVAPPLSVLSGVFAG
jgi:hypothetical protein